jgi:fluoride ion exporter CrcB/FEX
MQPAPGTGPSAASLPWRRYPRAIRFVAVGGAAGAAARWAVLDAAGPDRAVVVEVATGVAGALVLGLLIGLRLTRSGERRLTTNQFLLLGTGFFAAFAPFSTYAVRVATSLDAGHLTDALAVGLGTAAAAVVGSGLGYRIGSRR